MGMMKHNPLALRHLKLLLISEDIQNIVYSATDKPNSNGDATLLHLEAEPSSWSTARRHPRLSPRPPLLKTFLLNQFQNISLNSLIRLQHLFTSHRTSTKHCQVSFSLTMGSMGNTRAQPHIPKQGVWCPAITFFDRATDTVDWPGQKAYFKYLATTGLAGLVILGTNAEAFLLTTKERFQLMAAAREAVGPDFPLMAGVGSHSTKQTLELIEGAATARADYVLCLPPAYFGKATTPAVIQDFFDDVATASPLPVVIYNFPGVCNGVDLDSGIITAIAKRNSNVVGVKLTCGSVGKITRLAATFSPSEFATFGGQSDFLVGGLAAGSAGCIAAFANIAPRAAAEVYRLYRAGEFEAALKLQQEVALAESPCKLGIAATKYGVAISSAAAAGIEYAAEKLLPRKPYAAPTEAVKMQVAEALAKVNKMTF
jgi:4-hydroxy-2-oxoglutarate aldolase